MPNQKLVLVADDEEYWRVLLKRELEKLGCVVDIAASLFEAATLVDSKKYDLVVSDNSMPDENQGLTLLMHMRKTSDLNKGTRFILNTGDSGLEVQRKAYDLDGWYRNKYHNKISVYDMCAAGLE